MASGAMKDVRLFSTASIRIVKTSSNVSTVSKASACTGLIPEERAFSAWSFPGRMTETSPAAVMAPRNCIGMTQIKRIQSNAPAIHNPIET